MSRGPGYLQQRILRELSQEPGGRLWWRWAKERFPREVADKSFYRAIRSLIRMGRIISYEADYGEVGGRVHYISVVPVYEVGGRLRFVYEADRELNVLAAAAQRQLWAVAKARGLSPEPSLMESSGRVTVDAYRQGDVLSD